MYILFNQYFFLSHLSQIQNLICNRTLLARSIKNVVRILKTVILIKELEQTINKFKHVTLTELFYLYFRE